MSRSSKITLSPPGQPPFEVSLDAFYNCRNEALVQITATDDASTEHMPSTIVLVIDVSGSMSTMASTADDSDGASGLSQLDIVKHAARATIESLHEQDQLAVVSFCSNVKVEFQPAYMTEENRQKAWAAVDALYPSSATNLYGGLIRALDLIRDQESMPSNPSLMLLTDGLPNVSPPRGELDSLVSHLDANPSLRSVRIATFGFGYSLKSQLLADIARVGRSLYAFIPDSSFVGTVFVNAVANLLSSTSSTAQTTLKLEAAAGTELEHCFTGQNFTKTSWGLQIELPQLLYGQTLEILIRTKGRDPSKEPFTAFLEGFDDKPLTALPRYVDGMDVEDIYFCRAGVRAAVIGFIRAAGKCESQEALENAQSLLADWKCKCKELVQASNQNDDNATIVQEIRDILQDLDGQVTEAYSRLDWHKRWGVHYTLSLGGAHALQQCSNFKDPGLQTYATQKFTLLRGASEAKFIGLPPPKPSRRVQQEVKSMRAFYNSKAPCFASGPVLLANGTRRDISQICAGDRLWGGVRVRCVVETPIPTGVEGLVALEGGVTVTPWHPVRPRNSSKWCFPHQIVFPQWLACKGVFNLVLEDGGSSFCIGDFDAVSLGHGLRGDPVADHAFFGTVRVLKDLKARKGWANGHVVLPPNPLRRDPNSGAVIGFVMEELSDGFGDSSTPPYHGSYSCKV